MPEEPTPQEEPTPATRRAATKVRNKRKRREARAAAGRCPYCGKLPAPGKTRCARCIALQTARDRALTDARRAERDKNARQSAPRRCPRCESDDLAPKGHKRDRPYYRCRACGRESFGDAPPAPPPHSPCPYCRGRCIKHGTSRSKNPKPLYRCTVCGRININLWPGDAPSPGGPFPHSLNIGFDYAAQRGLENYFQTRGLSPAQAVREIFIAAAQKPRGYVSRAAASAARPLALRYERYAPSAADDWDDETAIVSVPLPPAPPPVIPPGGLRLPDLRPDAARKFSAQRGPAFRCPTVCVTWSLNVALNDAALAGLLAVMRDRNLNHQEAARALCAEAQP